MLSSYIMGVVNEKIGKPIRKASVEEKMLNQFNLVNDNTTGAAKQRKERKKQISKM